VSYEFRKRSILRKGPYRFFFYAGDKNEPVHIHIAREDKVAKYWLLPVRLQISDGFSRVELQRIQILVKTHEQLLVEAWYAYFSD